MYLVVLRRSGPEWDATRPLDEQSHWTSHAEYMDHLVAHGVVVLGGPLADEERVILIMEGESESEIRSALSEDPWAVTHLAVESVDEWTIRLDGRN